jgi:hypothetical protein
MAPMGEPRQEIGIAVIDLTRRAVSEPRAGLSDGSVATSAMNTVSPVVKARWSSG